MPFIALPHMEAGGHVKAGWSALWGLSLLLVPAAVVPNVPVEANPIEENLPATTRESPSPEEENHALRAGAPSREPTASLRTPIGADLTALFVEPNGGRAFVADRTNGRIVVVGTGGGNVIGDIPVRAEPSSIAWDGQTMFVGHYGAQTVLVINLTTLQVERELPTQFFIRSLASPQPGFLVATVHDPQGPGDFPWLFRASDGIVVQRLNAGPGLSEFDYRDAIVHVTLGAHRLYLVSTGSGDAVLQQYAVADYAQGTWSFLGTTASGDLGRDVRDIATFAGTDPVYIARGSGPLLEISPTTLRPVRTFGAVPASTTIVGQWSRIATSAGDEVIHVFRSDGTPLGNLTATGPVELLRAPWTEDRFVAIVGSGSTQDLVVGPTTRIVPVAPFAVVGTAMPQIAADIVSLEDAPAWFIAGTVDGVPLQPDSGFKDNWTAHPQPQLADGDHTVRIRALFHPLVDEATWAFTVDTTAPRINLSSAPPTSSVPNLVLSGTVDDLTPVTLLVAGVSVPLDGRGFVATAALIPGVNMVELVASDAAGNEARLVLRVIYTALGDWFLHPASRFRIRPPFGWLSQGNVTQDGAVADLLVVNPETGANLIIASEPRPVSGTPEEARAILQEALADISKAPGFFIQIPVTDVEIDGLPAARVVFRTEGGGNRFQQILVVIVGAQERLFWALIATVFEGQLHTMGEWLDASIRTFDALGAGPQGPSHGLSDTNAWLPLGVLAIAAVVSTAVAGAILWRRHRSRSR